MNYYSVIANTFGAPSSPLLSSPWHSKEKETFFDKTLENADQLLDFVFQLSRTEGKSKLRRQEFFR